MLNLFALGIIALSIMLAAVALLREQFGKSQPNDPKSCAISLDPKAARPTIMSEFDPASEAVLVQLPAEQIADIEPEDFATRPIADGTGLDILFRNTVLLSLPGLSTSRRVDLYVEPILA